jgi:Zn-dependent M28 family amino/carboxypeptidase
MSHRTFSFLILCFAVVPRVRAGSAPAVPAPDRAITASIRNHMAVLAGDFLLGRGSATPNELAAAKYIASELKRYKIEPAGDAGGFLQTVPLSPADIEDNHAGPTTVNVLGILRGADPERAKEVILFSAHLDHLGIGEKVNGDGIYNGADDDASGVCAVLELARLLGAGARPKRTVVFALFGSEELGGIGARWFREHPPQPLDAIVANLEFEMIGRDDPALAPRNLWLTGYERSNLGPALLLHGARIVADPHPEQNFFMRSDNYILARQGVIAQTLSSFGLHKDYHQPSDEISRIDFKHMAVVIDALHGAVSWLVNSDFKPHWNKDGKP